MKAMIFAAGKGTRLRPLTDTTPKALVEVGGHSLLKWLLLKMANSGIHDIVVNVHHLSGKIIEFLHSEPVLGLNIQISDESDLLLDTGGGLTKAARMLQGNEPVLIHNVDILSNLDFTDFEKVFVQSNSRAMLTVKDRSTSRKLEFSDRGQLSGWVNERTGEVIAVNDSFGTGTRYGFSGISMIDSSFPSLLKGDGVFGFIPACLDLAGENSITAYIPEHEWLDVGKSEVLPRAREFVDTHYKGFIK